MGTHRRKDYGDSLRAKTDDYAHKLYYQDDDFAVVDRITEIARRKAVSNAQIALAWLLHQPGMTAPIIGASTLEQLDDTVKGVDVKLTAEELKYLAEPYRPHQVLGHH
jgi:aryl-alcohol dehydrogenase (NADP+)